MRESNLAPGLIRRVIAIAGLVLLTGFANVPAAGTGTVSTSDAEQKRECQQTEASLSKLPVPRQKTALGLIYAEGVCRPYDRERALGYLREGANLGDKDAMYGFFVTAGAHQEAVADHHQAAVEWDEGLKWMRKSADLGNWRAALVVGSICYGQGKCGLPQDLKQARQWCKRYSDLAPAQARANHSGCDPFLQSAGAKPVAGKSVR